MTADLRALWLALAVLTAADAGLWWVSRPAAPVVHAALPGFDRARATGLRLGPVDAPTVIERGPDGWRLRAPVEGLADPAELDAILAPLADGVFPEAEVAQGGDLEPYGLAGGSEVRVEVSGDDGPLLALLVGADAGGEGTFVRFADDDRVYRARIGGRGRYDRPARTLLDRRVVGCTPAEVVHVAVPSGEASRVGGAWVGLDPVGTSELVAALCGLRGEVTDPARVEAWDLGQIALDGPEPV
ncbi:MAG: DUF4340 domain-containing protein, partial [Myxococcota bacterium]